MNWKAAAVVAAISASFASGAWIQGKIGDAKLARLEAETTERIAKQEKESYEVYRKQQEALAEAVAARDKALRSDSALPALCAATLCACASSPKTAPILTQDPTASQDASDYSERARTWLEKVRSFLQEQ